ncbi:MAG: hypothetical protein U0793_26485 [Gemmataceae bacterium]
MKLPASLLGVLAVAVTAIGLSGCAQEKPTPPTGGLSADPNADPANPAVCGEGGEGCPVGVKNERPCPACGRG